jgi:hemerythrin-like domain-containing protein
MKQDMAGPADTRMMPIVHDALRRDLRRLRSALSTTPYPSGPRKAALAEHITWLMDFLHAHHTSEDEGLYPMVRVKNADAAALLDQMDADHHAIDPAMQSLRAAGETWAASDDDAARRGVLTALEELHAVLDPHLEREENEAMPVVSLSITQREWHDWDQASNIKVKPLPRLAEEGNWLLDELDPARAEIVKAEVPAIPRFIVMYGFGPGYRRRAKARWGEIA